MSERTHSLSNADFHRLRALIYEETGINLSPEKKTMLEIRIRRRLRGLNTISYPDYCDYVFTPKGRQNELIHLIDVVTTNKTSFFREARHFDFLVSKALPALGAVYGSRHRFVAWSAGCSTGEEAYTLGILLSEYAQTHPIEFSVLATDISTEVLEKARLGIFDARSAEAVPAHLRQKYFMRSRDRSTDLLRIIPELRSKIEFRRLNFMDADYGVTERPEFIFCRNVIIYFDRATQFEVLERLCRLLAPSGYFFAGHSECLQGMNLPLIHAGPAVYRKCA